MNDIAKALIMYDKKVHPVGETLPTDQCVFFIKVVSTFLKTACLSIRQIYSEMFQRKVGTG